MVSILEIPVLIILLLLSRASCPPGWSVNGIRPSGEYECLGELRPPGCGEPDATSPPCMRPASSRGRLYCTGGTIPIVVDHKTVGCQARH